MTRKRTYVLHDPIFDPDTLPMFLRKAPHPSTHKKLPVPTRTVIQFDVVIMAAFVAFIFGTIIGCIAGYNSGYHAALFQPIP